MRGIVFGNRKNILGMKYPVLSEGDRYVGRKESKLSIKDGNQYHQTRISFREKLKYLQTDECIHVYFVIRMDESTMKDGQWARLGQLKTSPTTVVLKGESIMDSRKSLVSDVESFCRSA